MDMTTGGFAGAAPESNLIHCATAQLAHYYNLPYSGGTGIDAKIPDEQAGYERALQLLSNAMAGDNLIALATGMMEMMLTASYEQCVIDNEIMGAVYRMLEEVVVDDETLSLDLLRKVALKEQGHFLYFKETAEYIKRNNWVPKLTNRNVWNSWKAEGGKSMREVANDLAGKILKENNEPVISRDQTDEIMDMAKSFHKRAIEKSKNI
jgi:trimethylamine--corrinoid protein Co-methyltransferase